MNKEFVPFEEALALKELGFDEPCFAYYTDEESKFPASYSQEGVYPTNSDLIQEWISTPLYQQAFRWLREKGIYGDLTSDLSDNLEDRIFVYYIYSDTGCYYVDRSEEYKTYEMAQLACLKTLIKILKNE